MTIDELSKEFTDVFLRISIVAYMVLLAMGHYFNKNVDEIVFIVVLLAFHWAINKTVKHIRTQNLDIKENMYSIFEKIPYILLFPIASLTAIHYAFNALVHQNYAIISSVVAFVGSIFIITIVAKLEKRKILRLLNSN